MIRVLPVSLVALLALGTACSEERAAPTLEAGRAPSATLIGTWVNERGSQLVVDTVDADGHFHGAFRSGVGNVDPSAAFRASGIANGDVVGFSVSFGGAGSVATWSGQLTRADDEGGAPEDRLVTTWHLARDVADAEEAKGLWASTLTGHDVFRRAP
jgi:hypothetical protein